MLMNTGNRHTLTRAITTEDFNDKGKSFQDFDVLILIIQTDNKMNSIFIELYLPVAS